MHRIVALVGVFMWLGCGAVTNDDVDASDTTRADARSTPGADAGETPTADANNSTTYTVTVTRGGGGGGTITSDPAGLDCPGTCTLTVADGQQVTLSATPDAGSSFVGWTGGGCSGLGDCAITATQNVLVEVAFALDGSLVVTTDGTGTGVVTSNPAGINCGADCQQTYPAAETVVLTAAADASSTFAGWSGGGCSGTGTCTVSVSATTMVTATFTLLRPTLAISVKGNGDGTVTSNPAGIDCGMGCSAAYDYGASIVLSASPATGSTFLGWLGGGCTGTGTCTVSLTAATTVIATFKLAPRTLTVRPLGDGTGTVTSNPLGITCGTDCSEPYDYGANVVLTANPAANSTFTGWSGGGCSGTGTCAVSMTAAITVTATFTADRLTCSLVNNASYCTDGVIAEADLGLLTAAQCRDQCEVKMVELGMGAGCWVLATNLVCYCRSGTLGTGSTRPGGTCN